MSREPMLLVAPAGECPPAERVWGTGGWLSPDERRALDWLTLARLAGWDVTVTPENSPQLEDELMSGSRWIVFASDPERLSEDVIGRLAARLEAEPLLIVARAPLHGAFARFAGAIRRPRQLSGRSIEWRGPGAERQWNCRWLLAVDALDVSPDTTIWAVLDGAPMITARRVGRGTVATLGFHPSEARDKDGTASRLLRHLLIWGAGAPVAWHDLENCLVLRMDDPGGAPNVHLQHWTYTKLTEADWTRIGKDLARRRARMSIGYISGWVDDGDPSRGRLEIAGQQVERVAGRIHPSPLMTYHDGVGRTAFSDYRAEYRGIQALRARGLGDVELHGYTHMHADLAGWAKAPDRFEATSWYREFGRAVAPIVAALPIEQHPLAHGLEAVRRYFDVAPTTVIFPGDEFTRPAVERALDLGLRLVSSYFLALRDRDRFYWAHHVNAPYLDEVDAAWFDSGLPVVGYFHDRDLATHGVDWLSACLDRWQAAGARRLLDFRELAGIVGRSLSFEDDARGARLQCTGDGAPALLRLLVLCVRSPERLPARVSAHVDGHESMIDVEPVAAGIGRAVLPITPTASG